MEFEVTVPVEVETDKAILVNIEGKDKWVPISQIDDDSEVYQKGDTGALIVSEWWAVESGLV